MDIESKKGDSDINDGATTKAKSEKTVTTRKKYGEQSKYSGSRKSSLDTTNTGNTKNIIISKIENTYKLTPDENKRFYAYKIYPYMLELVTEKLKRYEKNNPSGYNYKTCLALTRDLADSLRREAKNMSAPRYKIVVTIAVGELSGQDVRVASRCLWNTEFDNCVSVALNNRSIWTSGVIYVLYTE